MKEELYNKIINKYPKVFRHVHYIECGDGWYHLIDTLARKLENEIGRIQEDQQEDFYATQIKEKFGTLRFYFSQETPYMRGAIAMAESMSSVICEYCGNPGEERGDGWVLTLCESCHKEREENRKSTY
jgi:hypothetical protein